LVVAPATAPVVLAGLTATYSGNPNVVTASTTPSGLMTTVTYDGAPTPPINAGSYAVVATVSDANHQGSASGTLVFAPATAPVVLAGLTATYSGNPNVVTASTTPSGLTTTVTYDGAPTPPINAGSYTVVATINDANHQGSASGTLVVAKATATVTLSGLVQTVDGTAKRPIVDTTPTGLGVVVTYDGSTTEPSAIGSYAVLATIDDPNHLGNASATLVISPLPVITLANLSHAEGNSATSVATLTASLSLASTATTTVEWSATAGSASAGSDFTLANGTLTFAAGEVSQPIPVTIAGDVTLEADETVVITLSNASGAVLGNASATLTILNDDSNSAPVIAEGTTATLSGDEDGSSTDFSLELHASDVDAGQEFTWSLIAPPAHGSVAALGNAATQAIAFQPEPNFNGSDTFTVRVADGAGGHADCVITVVVAPRNDPPVLTSAPVVTLGSSNTAASATTGTWIDSTDLLSGTITTTILWQRADDALGANLSEVAGATTTNRTLTAADVGHFLRVRITASDDGEGLPVSATTVAYSAFVAVPAPAGSSGGGSAGGAGGGGCGLGGGITGLVGVALLLLRRQRLR
jgi:hypothetical protein